MKQSHHQMGNQPQALLDRLGAIGQSLRSTGNALALLGLGSVGQETDRLDDYSDLDFFAIVKEGYKNAFIEHLDWLSSINHAVGELILSSKLPKAGETGLRAWLFVQPVQHSCHVHRGGCEYKLDMGFL